MRGRGAPRRGASCGPAVEGTIIASGEGIPLACDPSIIRDRFGRQARAFARSPHQRDPERLRGLLEFLDARPGARILDIACGPGIVTAALARGGFVAVGIDLTEAMVRESEAQAGSHYLVADAAMLPFLDGAFEHVVCRNSFHHFVDAPGVARQIAGVLRPGWTVLVEDMRAPDDPSKREYHETVERLRDPAHVRTLTRTELCSILGGAGLVIDRERAVDNVLDFEEWAARAFPPEEDKERARAMLEACLDEDRIGHEVWREGGRLKFRRRSMMIRALRPRTGS